MDPIKEAIEAVEMPEPIGEIVGRRLTPKGTREFYGYFAEGYSGDKKERVYTADQLKSAVRAALAAQQAGVQVPPGYKLVPVEPTTAMINAGQCGCMDNDVTVCVYKDMLAAAPEAPAGVQVAAGYIHPQQIKRLEAGETVDFRAKHYDGEQQITVFLAAAPEAPAQAPCRNDGRCQYAIDHGAEDLGHCPAGKCAMPTTQPAQAEAPAQAKEGFFGYVWGETDMPGAALLPNLAAVRQFIISEWLGDEESPDWQGQPILPGVMQELESYEWAEEGNIWEQRFEIGGIRIERVYFAVAASPQPAAQPTQGEAPSEHAAFEAELRRQCFQQPTDEAYSLAWSMWKARAALASQPQAEAITDDEVSDLVADASITANLPPKFCLDNAARLNALARALLDAARRAGGAE